MFNEFQFNELVFNGPSYYQDTASGGVVAGGEGIPGTIIPAPIEGGGAIVSGRTAVEHLRKFTPIRTGIARNMSGDNIIKTMEANRLRKPTITGRFANSTPTITPSYTYQVYPGWCCPGNPCKGSAIVAATTIRNQKGYLPPKASSVVITNPNMNPIAQLS